MQDARERARHNERRVSDRCRSRLASLLQRRHLDAGFPSWSRRPSKRVDGPNPPSNVAKPVGAELVCVLVDVTPGHAEVLGDYGSIDKDAHKRASRSARSRASRAGRPTSRTHPVISSSPRSSADRPTPCLEFLVTWPRDLRDVADRPVISRVHHCAQCRALHRGRASDDPELPTRLDGAFFARTCRLGDKSRSAKGRGGEPQALSPGAPRCAARGNRSRSPPLLAVNSEPRLSQPKRGMAAASWGARSLRECRLRSSVRIPEEAWAYARRVPQELSDRASEQIQAIGVSTRRSEPRESSTGSSVAEPSTFGSTG
jgi:hypothetical protein